MNTEQFLRNLWRQGRVHFAGQIEVCTDGTLIVDFKSLHANEPNKQRLTVVDNTVSMEPPR